MNVAFTAILAVMVATLGWRKHSVAWSLVGMAFAYLLSAIVHAPSQFNFMLMFTGTSIGLIFQRRLFEKFPLRKAVRLSIA